MAPPANDTRATAQLVPVGSYWGVVLDGTTVDATEDAGGPVDGYGAQDVFYTWSSLPAGNVYIYIQPKPSHATYFEAGCFSGSPTAWTSVVGFPGGFGSGDATTTCRFQHLHTGGPLSLVIYTYTGDPTGSAITFDFGWGHDLDATSSHWGANQAEAWATATDVAAVGTTTIRGVKQTFTAPISGTSVPAVTWANCAFENARDGVVDTPSANVYGCSYIGPGPGTTASGLSDLAQSVGSYYRAQGQPSIPPNPETTGRSDRVGVEQTLHAYRFGDYNRGPVTENTTPGGFAAYRTANDGPDDALVWGWDYTDASPRWETRNYYLGTFNVTNSYPTGHDVQDPCTITFRVLPQAVVWATSATVPDAANRVWLDPTTNALTRSYVTPDQVTANQIAAIVDLTSTAVNVANGATVESWLVHADGEPTKDRWLVGLFVATQTLSDTPPTFGDPPRTGQFTTIANRSLADTSGPLSWEARLPTWRPYIGFPLVAPAPSGWRVGRAAGGNTPW